MKTKQQTDAFLVNPTITPEKGNLFEGAIEQLSCVVQCCT